MDPTPSISKIMEMAEVNASDTTSAYPNDLQRLEKIHLLFDKALQCLTSDKPSGGLLWFLSNMLMMTHRSFLASARLCIGKQLTEAYMVLRGVLEDALYALYCYKNPDKIETWLNRRDDDITRKAVRDVFKPGIMFDLVGQENPYLKVAAKEFYDNCIDFGAHPNALSMAASLNLEGPTSGVYSTFAYFVDKQNLVARCLDDVALAGLISLGIFGLIFRSDFRRAKIPWELENIGKEPVP